MAVCEYRYCPTHEFAGHVWNYENQHGSLLGQCNDLGDRMVEFEYTDYGLTLDRPILADGRTGNLGSITHDGGNGITSIAFTNGTDVSSFVGAEVRVARPGAAANRLLFSNVVATAGGTTILVGDPGGVIYSAINGTGFGLAVLPFYTNFWGGTWTATATYNAVDGTTTFTGDFGTPAGGGALGSSVKPGMVVVPNLYQPVALHIVEVSVNLPGSDTLKVKGDARGLGGNGTRFRIHQQAPYKYDPGADTLRANNPCEMNPRALWSGYRRLPFTWSRAGEDPYLAWNRMYLPEIGRWTSSDPAASPWTNLNGYVGNPIQGRDTTGLKECSFIIHDNDDTFATAWNLGDAAVSLAAENTYAVTGNTWTAMLFGIQGRYASEGCDCIKAIEYWGHGAPGSATVALGSSSPSTMDIGAIPAFAAYLDWIKARWCCNNDGFYFRSCETAQDVKGQDFMKAFGTAIGASVSGHTHLISIPPDQPGKVTLPLGGVPGWGTSDGKDAYLEWPAGIVRLTGRVAGGGSKNQCPGSAKDAADHVVEGVIKGTGRRAIAAAEAVGKAAVGAVEKGATEAVKTGADVGGRAVEWVKARFWR